MLRAIKKIREKAKAEIDVLFGQYVINKKEWVKFINNLVDLTKKDH